VSAPVPAYVRQRVLELLQQGVDVVAIAERMGIHRRTVMRIRKRNEDSKWQSSKSS
jgi:IS30 family transposase